MIVTELSISALQLPFTDPPRWSASYDRQRELVVIDIETSSGITGMGYLMPLSGGFRTIAASIEELVKPHVMGRSIEEVETIWDELWTANYMLGRIHRSRQVSSRSQLALKLSRSADQSE